MKHSLLVVGLGIVALLGLVLIVTDTGRAQPLSAQGSPALEERVAILEQIVARQSQETASRKPADTSPDATLAQLRTTITDAEARIAALEAAPPADLPGLQAQLDANTAEIASVHPTIEGITAVTFPPGTPLGELIGASDILLLGAIQDLVIILETDVDTKLAAITTDLEDQRNRITALEAASPPAPAGLQAQVDANTAEIASVRAPIEAATGNIFPPGTPIGNMIAGSDAIFLTALQDLIAILESDVDGQLVILGNRIGVLEGFHP